MSRIIEITVSPSGESTVRTRGYAGGDCRSASEFVEKALGRATAETLTAEFFGTQPAGQKVDQVL